MTPGEAIQFGFSLGWWFGFVAGVVGTLLVMGFLGWVHAVITNAIRHEVDA